MKITAKFRASRHHRFEDIKRIMSPKIRPRLSRNRPHVLSWTVYSSVYLFVASPP